MADNETIADIIAEKRRRADELEASSYRPHQFLRERIAELRQEADRLEAALKRDTKELRVEIERLKEERNYSGVRERERLRAKGFAIVPKEQLERGDCAKLREALVKCCEIALQWQADEAAGVAGTTDKPHARSAAEAVIDMEFELNAALSVPPRNCDVYNNESCRMAYHLHGDGLMTMQAFADWLFAPATEKEGGNDAD